MSFVDASLDPPLCRVPDAWTDMGQLRTRLCVPGRRYDEHSTGCVISIGERRNVCNRIRDACVVFEQNIADLGVLAQFSLCCWL